ncbi:epimerase [Brachybacterium phenoliresistens]|uniref:Epimerase n=1 Tax=Brachybacterium phenoliresistens TaxID=396014 RepID=Z9JTS2_9MICO|nr:NAD(P)H-binding protein [Brachybacterium phenoliresistens]EWS81569.1 epimerase [Brachybacterium phenoliresistens]
MHHLVIGEGQIGRAIIEHALADGDQVTILRRRDAAPEPPLRRVRGDVQDPAALSAALEGVEAIHACFHAPYDARIWRRDLPPRELAVLDAAAERGIPVVFPESMYGFQGAARRLSEGAAYSPQDAKGEVRVALMEQRRRHPARTLSIVAADLLGPTAVGTGAAVVCTLLIERMVAGARPIVFGDPAAPHVLTFIPDLAVAMLHAARHAERLAGAAGDAVLHAPSAPARSQAELIAATAAQLGTPARWALRIPRTALRAAAPVSTFARELAGISGLWYAPCTLEPGILQEQEGLRPTSWEEALRRTVAAAVAPAGAEAGPVPAAR